MYEAEIVIRRNDRQTLFSDLAAVSEFLEHRRAERNNRPSASDAIRTAERIVRREISGT